MAGKKKTSRAPGQLAIRPFLEVQAKKKRSNTPITIESDSESEAQSEVQSQSQSQPMDSGSVAVQAKKKEIKSNTPITIESDSESEAQSEVQSQSQSQSMDSGSVAVKTEIRVISGGKNVSAGFVSYTVYSLAVSVQDLLAVGAAEGKIYLYSTSSLKPHTTALLEDNTGTVSSLAFSPDGSFLAAGDSNGRIVTYSIPKGFIKTATYRSPAANIDCIAGSPSSSRAASGSIGTNVYASTVVKPMDKVQVGHGQSKKRRMTK